MITGFPLEASHEVGSNAAGFRLKSMAITHESGRGGVLDEEDPKSF